MKLIALTTHIHAPILRCFNLSLSIDLHQHSATSTNEKAIAGITSGLIGLNETVTWKATHFGFPQVLTVQITDMHRPSYFKDVMLSGAFKRMEHEHFFEERNGVTIMNDRFLFEAPFLLIGRLAENLFLEKYLTSLLLKRNEIIREVAESEKYRLYLGE